MSIITPIVDTLLQNVLGRRGEVERVAARQAEQPLGGISRLTPLRDGTSQTPDERLAQRTGGASRTLEGEAGGTGRTSRGGDIDRNLQLGGAESRGAENRPAVLQGQAGNASARIHLSQEAQTIARLLDRFPADVQAVKSGQPLLSGKSVSGESNAARLSSSALSSALSGQVRHSGLFYESHLSQWLKGNYETGELMREPQGKLARLVATLASSPSGAQTPTVGPAAHYTAMTPSGQASGFGQMAASMAQTPIVSLPVPQGASGSQSRAASAQFSPLLANQSSVAERAAQLAQVVARGEALVQMRENADTQTASRQRGAAEPVHDSLLGILRHQLELLSQPLFRWDGFLAPDIPMRWEMEEEEAESGTDEAPLRTWRSRLYLDMPQLGELDIDIRLQGGMLHVSGEVDEAALALVRRQGGGLAERLEAAGVAIASMNFSSRIATDASSDG